MQPIMPTTPKVQVVVVGAGGNIGSHLVPHLGRMPGVTNVTLVDKDRYETKNLDSQSITPRDVGLGKAGVQARILRRISPSLTVTALNHAVEELPLGRMRAAVIVACLDSRRSRQYVNQAAWRLGVPWIDAGVQADGLLARVNAYIPAADNPCLECAWDQRDYDALEQVYPCASGAQETYATNAPSSLGALAAALEAIECQKLLGGQFHQALISKQFVIDARHHHCFLTSYRRNPCCRFPDHEPWKIRQIDLAIDESTLADVIDVTKSGGLVAGAQRFSIEGKRFIGMAICRGCGQRLNLSMFIGTSQGSVARCESCTGSMVAAGTELSESVDLASVPAALGKRLLRDIGLRSADVFTIEGNGVRRHYEVADRGELFTSPSQSPLALSDRV